MFSARCPKHGSVARNSDSPAQFCPFCGAKLVVPPSRRWRRRGIAVFFVATIVGLIWYVDSCRTRRMTHVVALEASKNEALADLPQSWAILCRSLEHTDLASVPAECMGIMRVADGRYADWLEQRITDGDLKGFPPLQPGQIDAFLIFFPSSTHARVCSMLRKKGLFANAPP